MRLFRRKSTWDKRDDAIAKASDLLHEAVRQLRSAHYYAADMGDPEFATALWEIGDLIPVVTREVDAYLYDWAAIHQPPRHTPFNSVRRFREQ